MVKRVITRVKNTSLKNKIFFSTTLVIFLISVPIALFTRWILFSSLVSELHRRGIGIAQSIAESSRSHILTNDIPRLTSLVFDARLGERRSLINYAFILDKNGKILAHTFTHPFPENLQNANPLASEQGHGILELRVEGATTYDVAVPIREGIYQIGIVHVGLYKKHIDQLIGKLRTTFLGFVSVMTLFCFLISHRLALYITRPVDQLTLVSDQLSQGNFDVPLDVAVSPRDLNKTREPLKVKDEVKRLANSFLNMTRHIKQSQAKLRVSEEKYRSMFASGPNPIFVIDRHTLQILDANPSAEDVYAYTRDELIGRPFTQLGPFVFKPIHAVMARNRASARIVTISSKVQYVKKDGTPIYVNVHACPVHYGDKAALIVATTDITEMVEKDSQLIQFSKLKTLGEMSAGIAHELNQPLNAIKMGSEFLEMMLDDAQKIPPQDLHDAVVEMSNQVDRASEIIMRLRDFGRKSDFTREKVPLNKPVQSVLQILGRQLALQNISVELDLTSKPPGILAHPNRLEQVVFNLLTNARDALIQKPVAQIGSELFIRIRTSSQNGWATLSVADNGIGIPSDLKQKIFEAFFTTKEMGEGMGLGLSITLGIVEDYGGKIEVEERKEGGTMFTLHFPITT